MLDIDIPEVDRPPLIIDLLSIPVGGKLDLKSCYLVRKSDTTFILEYDDKLFTKTIDDVVGGIDEYYFSDSSDTGG